jgi:hypothetical protein
MAPNYRQTLVCHMSAPCEHPCDVPDASRPEAAYKVHRRRVLVHVHLQTIEGGIAALEHPLSASITCESIRQGYGNERGSMIRTAARVPAY